MIKYLKIFPAGLLNSLYKKSLRNQMSPPPPLVETCTLTRGGGQGTPVIHGYPLIELEHFECWGIFLENLGFSAAEKGKLGAG